jgi:ABC-type nitrate/sulfonate/bicarbonate transport system substrate-binding protein
MRQSWFLTIDRRDYRQRPKRIYILAMGLHLLAAFFLEGAVRAADMVRIGLPSPAAQFIPLPLAKEKGFLKHQGLDGEIIRLRGNQIPITALINGDIDYHTVIGNGVRAAIQGLPLRVIACFLPAPPFALVARREFKSVKELKGQAIGTGAFGATTDIVGRMLLRHFGLDPDKEVKFVVSGDAQARLAALKQGLTAATVMAVPGDYEATKMGFVVLARAHELFTFPDSGLVTTIKKIKEKPAEVKGVIKAGIMSNNYIRSDREGTIRFLMDKHGSSKELAVATYDSVRSAFNEDGSVPDKGLRVLIDEARKSIKLGREVSITEVADLALLYEAQNDLGIKVQWTK